MSVEQLDALRKKALLIACIGFPLAAILFFVLIAEDMPIAGFISLVVIGIATVILYLINKRKFVSGYKETFVKTALESSFDDLVYEPDNGIPEEVIKETGFIRLGNKYSSSDYIKASYNSTPFELSDVLIQDEHETTDSKGDTTTETDTIFHGQWMIFRFNKNFVSTVQVRQKFFGNSLFGTLKKTGKKIEMEDIEFNKLFTVFAESQQEAFYILTPHIMAKMKEISKKSDAQMMYGFKDNLLHIAVSSSKDSFSPKMFKKLDAEKAKADISSSISIITGFIEELKLDNDLFKN